jgi:hypothetical protein
VTASGEVHHHHDANHDSSGEHHHHTDGRGHHVADRLTSSASWSGGHWWHLHIHLLGFELTLPEPAPDEGDRQSDERDTVFVLASGKELLPCQRTQSTWIQQLVRPSVFSLSRDAATMQIVASSPAPVSCAPLCDSARLERSGVLMA